MENLKKADKFLDQARYSVFDVEVNGLQHIVLQLEIARDIVDAQLGIECLRKDLLKKEK